MRRRALAILIAALATAALACAPVATPAPSRSPGPSPNAFPPTTGEVLAAGRYTSSPPFDVPFAFAIGADGWETMHHHCEFFDIGRFATADRQTAPVRWIAFGHPKHIGGDDDVAAAGLSPEEAAALLAARDDLMASEVVPFSLAGLEGVRLDLHAPNSDTPIFGGPDGAFNLEPSIDIRLGIVPLDDDLLLVFIGAPPDELDAAWDEAQPVLESVDL
jgi:hypothetical protein